MDLFWQSLLISDASHGHGSLGAGLRLLPYPKGDCLLAFSARDSLLSVKRFLLSREDECELF
jgi:hypothetical protein